MVVHGVPRLESVQLPGAAGGPQLLGVCRCYLQVFLDGRLLRTVPSGGQLRSTESGLRWSSPSEAELVFLFDGAMALSVASGGELLFRLRHLRSDGRAVSVVRFQINSGWVEPGVSKLFAHDLDGAEQRVRRGQLTDELRVDVILTAAEAEAVAGAQAAAETAEDGLEAGEAFAFDVWQMSKWAAARESHQPAVEPRHGSSADTTATASDSLVRRVAARFSIDDSDSDTDDAPLEAEDGAIESMRRQLRSLHNQARTAAMRPASHEDSQLQDMGDELSETEMALLESLHNEVS